MAPCCGCCWAGAPAHKGPPVPDGALQAAAPYPLRYLGGWAPLGPFLAASGPPLPRGPCPSAGPVGAAAPAGPSAPRSGRFGRRGLFGPSPGPGRPCCPPGPPLGLVRRGPCPCSLRRSLAPSAPALPSLRCGLPVRSALLRLRRGLWAARGPPGGSLRAPCGASGPAAPRGAPRRPLAAFFPLRGPRVGWLRGPACRALLAASGGLRFPWVRCALLGLRRARGRWRGSAHRWLAQARFRGSPLRPPPAAPAGGSGSPRPDGAPPRLRRAPEGLPPRTPLRRGPPAAGGPGAAFPARFTFRKL